MVELPDRCERVDWEAPPRLELCSIFGSLFGSKKKKKQEQQKAFVPPAGTVGKPRRKSASKASPRFGGYVDKYQRREPPSKDPYNRRGQ